MSANLPNGTKISIGSAYGSAIPVTALSNADPAEATANAHGLADNDIVVVSSGWPLLDGKTVRLDGVDTNTFELEGINSTSTSKYEAGGGVGSVKKVTTWTRITQVTASNSSGGEQQFVQWVYLEDGQQRQRPTFRNARSLVIKMADDPSLPWYAALKEADEDGEPRAVRFELPNGSYIYYNMYVAFDDEPSTTANEIMEVTATLSLVARSTRYAS